MLKICFYEDNICTFWKVAKILASTSKIIIYRALRGTGNKWDNIVWEGRIRAEVG
jgi:hypothetical protein